MTGLLFKKLKRRNRVGNKYGAERSQGRTGGKFYDSQLEADYRRVLEMMMAAGEIKDLVDQPQVYLTDAQIPYRPDFAYVDKATGERIFAECKGAETEGYLIKLKLWTVYGPGPLYIVKRKRAHDLPGVVRKVVPKHYIMEQKKESL